MYKYFNLSRVRGIVGESLVLLAVLGLEENAELFVELGQLVGEYVEVVADLARRCAAAVVAVLRRIAVDAAAASSRAGALHLDTLVQKRGQKRYGGWHAADAIGIVVA